MIRRKFMYIGENERDDFFDFVPVNGEVYDGSTVIHKSKGFDPDYTILEAASASFNDWKEVGQEAFTEQDFINKCAIEAMSGFISGAKQFYDIRSQKDICEASWNLAERMNEERKKRLKKSSS